VRALQQGKIAGAGLDVTPVEPLPPESPMWTMPNVAVTPHTAGASPQRSHRNVLRFIENLKHYRASEPLEGLIDKQKGF
jgi:phosphoglycerate dehydrogenase-like enzyme